MKRHWKIVSAITGVVLVVFSLLWAFAFGPSLAKLPGGTNTTRSYSGTAPVMLNPAAIGGGGQLLLRNVPIQLTHTDKVVKTDSSAAAVQDVRSVTVRGGATQKLPNTYVVDRKNLGPSTSLSYPGATKQVGLTFNFPIGTEKKSYVGWVPDTMTTTTLHYVGTATRGGVSTYVFRSVVPATPIKEPAELAGLPQGVPKSALPALATQLGASASALAQLNAVMGRLPATIPVGYTFASTSTFWVEPTTGIIVDQSSTDARTVFLPASVLGAQVTVAPLSQFVYAYTPDTVTQAGNDASSKTDSINFVETWLPLIIGLVGGGLLVAAGAGYLVSRRRPPANTAPMTQSAPKEPVGGGTRS